MEDTEVAPRAPVGAREIWAVIRRSWWILALTGLICGGVAALFALRMTPVFGAATTLRFVAREPNIPDVFRTLPTGTAPELLTDIEMLKSRSLAEEVVSGLGLQVRLREPHQMSRDSLLTDLRVPRGAAEATYVMVRREDGKFAAIDAKTDAELGLVTPGQRVRLKGVEFVLSPTARRFPKLELSVNSFESAVENLSEGLSIAQTNREATIVRIGYEDSDRDLAWRVPNLMAQRFMQSRLRDKQYDAGIAIAFLRQQRDTLINQLALAEDKLRDYQEDEHVVAPEVEASSQVTRLVALQAERSELEAERSGLAALLSEIHAADRTQAGETATRYRRLLAFPSLLQHPMSSQLLGSLGDLENQRTELLTRRTPADPDVQLLDARIAEIEVQIHGVATTYLAGLNHKAASLDGALRGYQGQLARLPRRDLQYARLTRQPKILENMVDLIQTKLKEAEIAQGSVDPSVGVVDQAIVPVRPVRPQRRLFVLASLFIGLGLGGVVVVGREYLDRSVHSRADVANASGVRVVGLIPRLRRRGLGLATIVEKQTAASVRPQSLPPAPPVPSPAVRMSYTFFGDVANGDTPITGLPEQAVTRGATGSLFASTEVGRAHAEAYASLHTNLMYSGQTHELKVLLVTSALPGEGKTTNAVNLAFSLAQRGLRILLIDGDLRRGVMHRLFEVTSTPGLSDVLLGYVGVREACRAAHVEGWQTLHYLTRGRGCVSPPALLESPAMRSMILQVRDDYDMVILDSPPANIVTDAAVVAPVADGVIIIARAGVTMPADLQYAMEQLGHVREKVLGIVLNDIDLKRDAYYDAAYRYRGYDEYLRSPAG